MTRALLDWAFDVLLIGWVGLMITLAIVAVWCFVDMTRHPARRRYRRRRGRTDIKERPPRAQVG